MYLYKAVCRKAGRGRWELGHGGRWPVLQEAAKAACVHRRRCQGNPLIRLLSLLTGTALTPLAFAPTNIVYTFFLGNKTQFFSTIPLGSWRIQDVSVQTAAQQYQLSYYYLKVLLSAYKQYYK